MDPKEWKIESYKNEKSNILVPDLQMNEPNTIPNI